MQLWFRAYIKFFLAWRIGAAIITSGYVILSVVSTAIAKRARVIIEAICFIAGGILFILHFHRHLA